MRLIYFPIILSLLFLSACSSISRVDHIPKKIKGDRNLVVFFDGTANDEGSHTNISKLHSLVTLQNRNDISTTYIPGVGTGSKIIGMAMGWGIGNDVREAYLYLIENYDPVYDKVSIFGFSRGAYAARILSALLYTAGLPNAKHLNTKEKKLLVDDIYTAYKSDKNITSRRKDIQKMIKNKWHGTIQYNPKPVNIRFLGLWETVEALGLPNFKENINEPNKHYADQLCNIEAASQALSIDDDRARIFTPLLLSRKHLYDEKCVKGDTKIENSNTIHEVWFSGAHSDVGGGYNDTNIDGISLNWMLDEIKNAGLNLVPKNTKVYSDYLGVTHNPEAGLFGLIYRERTRNIPCYTQEKNATSTLCNKDAYDIDYKNTSTSLSSPFVVHQSVLDRLCMKAPQAHESFWFREPKYQNCISCDINNRGYVINTKRCQEQIGVIHNKSYQYRKVTSADNYCDYSPCWKEMNATYKGTKSCNYFHKNITKRAKQRLTKTDMNTTGMHKTIIVYADVKNDKTGIFLSKDKFYSFQINKVEDWVDCDIHGTNPISGRPIFSSKTFLNNFINLLGKPIAYAPFSGYMELLGVVGSEQFKIGRLSKSQELFSPNEDGELILRVNEPRYLESVYMNNHGVLELTIHTH